MHLLLDHAVAFLVAAAILFTIVGLQLRGQRAAIDTSQYYNSKEGAQALLELVEQDFHNLGAGMLDPSRAILPVGAQSFQFYGQTDLSVPDSQLVSYTWTETGTVSLESGEVDTYRVTRTVDGAATATSFDSVTDFSITLRDEDLLVITDDTNPAQLARTRRIDVSATAVSQFGVGETIEETRWFRNIRPANLSRLYGGSLTIGSGP